VIAETVGKGTSCHKRRSKPWYGITEYDPVLAFFCVRHGGISFDLTSLLPAQNHRLAW